MTDICAAVRWGKWAAGRAGDHSGQAHPVRASRVHEDVTDRSQQNTASSVGTASNPTVPYKYTIPDKYWGK